MAQRISRAKRTVSGVRFNRPGDVATVLRALYLVFNEGYSGDVDLADEAIRLTCQLAARTRHEEVAGLLALMLLHHARRPARTGSDGGLVRLTGSPVARLNRAVALGEADGTHAGLAALAELDPALPRHTTAAAYLHERAGDLSAAARLYAEAARAASNLPERDHLTRQAARLNARLRGRARDTPGER